MAKWYSYDNIIRHTMNMKQYSPNLYERRHENIMLN